MPWTVENPPSPAENWTEAQKRRCVEAANAALRDGKTDEEAIFACIGAAGKQRKTYGDAVKVVSKTDNWLRVKNHIVLFGGEDLDGEHFDEETDVESDYTRTIGRLAVDFEHGMGVDQPPEGVEDRPPGPNDLLGFVDWDTAQKTDLGWLVESVLDRRNRYVQAFEPLIEAGMVGTSSQAAGEGVEVDEDGTIKTWPLMRNSLTVNPAEPKMLGGNALQALKTFESITGLAILPKAEKETAAEESEPTGQSDPAHPGIKIVRDGESKMGEQETPQVPEVEYATKSDLEAVSAKIDKLLDYVEAQPAQNKAGTYIAQEELAPDVTNFADFLMAVRRRDMKRIKNVYGTGPEKTLSGETADSAGILVPEAIATNLLQIAEISDPIMGLVDPIPVTTDHGKFPALDNFITPTAGSGEVAAAAGVVAKKIKRGDTYQETEPGFAQIEWMINKVGGVTPVDNDLMDDSPYAIEALLRRLFGIAIGAKNARNVLRGSGVGEPLGILNAPCAISVSAGTAGTFAWPDLLNMRKRLRVFNPGSVRMVMHQYLWPDIGVWESSSGGSVWQANYQDPLGVRVGGYLAVESEHMPLPDALGNVILVDFSIYMFFQRSLLSVAYSEHARFEKDQGVWRFDQRNDGKPWLLDKITLANPGTAATVSPIVYLAD